jgi:predicted AlkP superfamily pyrophosphatase or phosphodiesterase
MRYTFVIIISFFFITISSFSQDRQNPPKLVVGIVIDQFRAEFLERYYDDFGEDGFKRIMREGFNFRNAHFNYMPTSTGPGHAAVFTGALPELSGIVNNDWYERSLGKVINVVHGNDKYKSVGIPDTLTSGQAGPDFLLVSTIADELKKASQFKSKSIAVSIKDRSAILAAGHAGDGAFWFDSRLGKFITSTYYAESLPAWVESFNNSGYIDSLNQSTWDLSLPIEEYNESRSDRVKYEIKMRNKSTPSFPYNMAKINEGMDHFFYLPNTPFGNEMVAELGKIAIVEEKLGEGGATDFMAINFSSTDYAGHRFGPYSMEIQDMYLKLDQTMASLIQFLDEEVGREEYVLFVTADHGVVASPVWLMDNNLPGGLFNPSGRKSRLNTHIRNTFGLDSVILHADNYQIYLDYDRFVNHMFVEEVADEMKRFLEKEPSIQSAYTRKDLLTSAGGAHNIRGLLQNSFHPKRSGDVFYIGNPGWLGISPTQIATSHGSPYSYDTHVPIMWLGKNVPAGSSVRKVHVTDIAPTLSFICRVMLPSGSYGEALFELFD